MDEDKNIEELPIEENEYSTYFKADLDAIEEELKKSKEYSEIIDKEISQLSAPGLATKGSQHYLIEHITNAVQLQTQRQGLRKDRVAIKKLILDYTNRKLEREQKANTEKGDTETLMESLKKFLESEKATDAKTDSKVKEIDLDSAIDEILNESTDKGEN